MTNTSLLFKTEKEIAKIIINELESQEITMEKASKIAQYVLNILPQTATDEQVMEIITTHSNAFLELSQVAHKELINYEKKHKDWVSQEVKKLMYEGKYKEANELMKNYFGRKL